MAEMFSKTTLACVRFAMEQASFARDVVVSRVFFRKYLEAVASTYLVQCVWALIFQWMTTVTFVN